MVDQIFENVNLSEDGRISYSEFLAATIDIDDKMMEKGLKEVFEMLDLNHDGLIGFENLLDFF